MGSTYNNVPQNTTLDRWGILASLLCGIHCLIMPVAFPLLATLGMSWLDHWQTEWAIMLTTVVIAESSLLRSLVFEHGRILPVVMASLGFIFFAASFDLSGPISLWLRLIGGLALMAGHFLNMRFTRQTTSGKPFGSTATLRWALLFVLIGASSLWCSFDAASSQQLPETREELMREIWQVNATSNSN